MTGRGSEGKGFECSLVERGGVGTTVCHFEGGEDVKSSTYIIYLKKECSVYISQVLVFIVDELLCCHYVKCVTSPTWSQDDMRGTFSQKKFSSTGRLVSQW